MQTLRHIAENIVSIKVYLLRTINQEDIIPLYRINNFQLLRKKGFRDGRVYCTKKYSYKFNKIHTE